MITSQINSYYECRNERMKKYLEEVKNRIGSLEVKFIQIPREENECADRLVKAASAEFMSAPKQVLSLSKSPRLSITEQKCRNKSRRELDHAINSILEVRHSARQERRR